VAKATQIEWRKAHPAPVVLVSGPETYTADTAIRRMRNQLRDKYPVLEVHDIDAAQYSAGQLDDLASPSLFAEPRLIIIRGVERCSDALITDGIAYLGRPAEDTYVIIRHSGSSVRGKKFLDALRNDAAVIEITNPEHKYDSDRTKFVQAEFALAKRPIAPAAVRDLVNAFSGDIGELAAACDQLMVDAESTITEETVERYYGGRIQATGFKVADQAFAGPPAQALAVLRHSLASGVEIQPILGALGSKIRVIAKLYSNRSLGAQEIGMHPYVVDQIRKLVPGWNEEGIANVITALAEADSASKGAERDPVFAIERLVTLIAYRGELPQDSRPKTPTGSAAQR
jgi:DNA polymerase-3 subunit delta